MHVALVPFALALSSLALQGDAPAASEAAKGLDQATLERMSDEIRGEIEQLRKQDFSGPVAVQLSDAETFRAYVAERMAREETPQSLAAQADGARLLGLAPPGVDLQEELQRLLDSQVGGFYDPQTDTFYLMESFSGDLARFILAHELVHALDDQLYDIDGTLARVGGTTDADFAYHALVEGSATKTGFDWAAKHMDELDPAALGDAGLQMPPMDAPPFLWKPLLGAYMKGLGFVERGRKAHEQGFLGRAFDEPPRSSEQVLHPEKYWDPARRDEPRALAFAEEAAHPAGWSVLHEDTLGELGLALVVEPRAERKGLDPRNPLAVLALRYSGEATEGWGGDRSILLGKGDERALRLVSVWDSEQDAHEFAAALRAVAPPAEEGVTWTIRAGDEPASLPEGAARDVVVLDARTRGAEGLELPAWRELASDASAPSAPAGR